MLYSSYWDVFAVVGHVFDNLEAPHDHVVEKVAAASQPILASMTIEGSNNIRTAISHNCFVPPSHDQIVQLPLLDLLHEYSYWMVQKLMSETIVAKQ